MIQGIDVSRWQGEIDWEEVKDAGTRFAFIKATEGGDHIDPSFRRNWAGAKKHGIARSAYHFVWWCRTAKEQVHWFKKAHPRDPDALPPVLDVEWQERLAMHPEDLARGRAGEDRGDAERPARAHRQEADHLHRHQLP